MRSGSPSPGYVGRFAPSPTGPLHFGSLLAAVASYLDARAHQGKWLLRVEDIDPPRAQEGAIPAIIEALETYGFEWHGEVCFQSHQAARHRELIRELVDAGRAYPCSCSRLDLAGCRRGPLGTIYPGYCRNGCKAPETAIRVLTDAAPIGFTDRLQGRQVQNLETDSGDFVILRRDGLIAYQLAVVADDFAQGVTHVVRGIDLMDSTPRQIHLQNLLGYPTPQYAHIPVVENAAGLKLGKSTGAPGISLDNVRPTLVAALKTLAQHLPDDLGHRDVPAIWAWAIAHWNLEAMAGCKAVPAPTNPPVQGPNQPS